MSTSFRKAMSVLKTKPRGRVEVVQDENKDTSVRDGHFTDKLVDIVCYTYTPLYPSVCCQRVNFTDKLTDELRELQRVAH